MTRQDTSSQCRTARSSGNIILVINLSYFVQESHLMEIFNLYGHVQHIQIIRNTHTAELCSPCALVTMENPAEAKEMARILNNHLLMGRRIRISPCDGPIDFPSLLQQVRDNNHLIVEVNFSLSPAVTSAALIKRTMTESLLTRFFVKFGGLVDVAIKRLADNHEGQALITFNSREKVEMVRNQFRSSLSFDDYVFAL